MEKSNNIKFADKEPSIAAIELQGCAEDAIIEDIIRREEISDKKIYISGPISRVKDLNINRFLAMEKYLIRIGFGRVINPHRLDHSKCKCWRDYMIVDIKALVDCDYICMLPKWRLSRGARLERKISRSLNIKEHRNFKEHRG